MLCSAELSMEKTFITSRPDVITMRLKHFSVTDKIVCNP